MYSLLRPLSKVLKYWETNGRKDLGIKQAEEGTRYNDGKNAETQNRVKHYEYIISNGYEV